MTEVMQAGLTPVPPMSESPAKLALPCEFGSVEKYTLVPLILYGPHGLENTDTLVLHSSVGKALQAL